MASIYFNGLFAGPNDPSVAPYCTSIGACLRYNNEGGFGDAHGKRRDNWNGLTGVLIVIVLILAIAALINYLKAK